MEDIFILYFVITAMITMMVGYMKLTDDTESEIYKAVSDIVWNTGLERNLVEGCAYLILACFGWIIVPCIIMFYIWEYIEELLKGERK